MTPASAARFRTGALLQAATLSGFTPVGDLKNSSAAQPIAPLSR
jgi:hypothetical protein